MAEKSGRTSRSNSRYEHWDFVSVMLRIVAQMLDGEPFRLGLNIASLALIGLCACTSNGGLEEESSCELPQATQGNAVVEPWTSGPAEDLALSLSEAMLADPSTAFVAWRGDAAEVYRVSTGDAIHTLLRRQTDSGWAYQWESGRSPLTTDVRSQATYLEELSAGDNPNETTYPDNGYDDGDERLSFVGAENAVYPLVEERIVQLLTAKNAPEFIWSPKACAAGGRGSHGGMSLAQSRAPLLLHGPGLVEDAPNLDVRVVDIAPTVAALLGVKPVSGLLDGHEASGLMLANQDGRILHEVLESSCSYGSAERAVVLILDGLSHTELERALSAGQLPNIGRLAAGGLRMPYGSIVGFPSFSLPGHVSVHTGVYPGNHGLLSNEFIDRSVWEAAVGIPLQQLLLDPVEAQRVSDQYLATEVETLFEAVNRSFPEDYTASINELVIRGAGYCRLNNTERSVDDYPEYELGDELALFDLDSAWTTLGPPKYLGLSFYLTKLMGGGPTVGF